MIPGLDIERGALTSQWATIGALATDRFDLAEDYFAICAHLYAGLDRRGQAAFFIGGISYYAAAVLAWFDLRGEVIPSLEGFGVALNSSKDGLAYRFADCMPNPDNSMAVLETALAPLVKRLKAETRLAESAQWRLIADSIAATYQEVGRALGCAPAARDRAMAHITAGRAANPQTGYHRLEIAGEERHYLKRGGCCRWYTADNGAYCASCIMRSPADQIAELLAQS